MKRALSVLGQTILLLLAAVVFGIVLPGTHHSPFHVVRVLSSQGFQRRQYEFDWLIGVGLVYLLLLLIGVLTKRIRRSWRTSTFALAITLLVVLLFTKIGFKEGSELDGSFSRNLPALTLPRANSDSGAHA